MNTRSFVCGSCCRVSVSLPCGHSNDGSIICYLPGRIFWSNINLVEVLSSSYSCCVLKIDFLGPGKKVLLGVGMAGVILPSGDIL